MQGSIEAARLARIRAEIVNAKELPTVPALLIRILEVADGDRSSVQDLVGLMARDQALTGRVLRLANSGFLGLAGEVATLSRAVMLLGFSTVRSLALGVKVWETLAGRAGSTVAALWEHSALVAAAARLIAQRTRAVDSEVAFTAGLLHDMGRAILSLRFPAAYAPLADAAQAECLELERHALGVDHAQAGAWLAHAWSLPAAIAQTAATHHDALVAGAPVTVPAVVNLANRLVHWTDLDAGTCDPEAERQLGALGVGLPFAAWVEISALLAGQKDELRALFGGTV